MSDDVATFTYRELPEGDQFGFVEIPPHEWRNAVEVGRAITKARRDDGSAQLEGIRYAEQERRAIEGFVGEVAFALWHGWPDRPEVYRRRRSGKGRDVRGWEVKASYRWPTLIINERSSRSSARVPTAKVRIVERERIASITGWAYPCEGPELGDWRRHQGRDSRFVVIPTWELYPIGPFRRMTGAEAKALCPPFTRLTPA